MMMAKQTGTPLVHLVHNDRQLTFHRVESGRCDLAIWNSRWIEAAAEWDGPQTVVYPPVWVGDYQLGQITQPSDPCLALLNCTEAKGAPLFYELARLLPEVRFLAIQGAYGVQVAPPAGLPNVESLRNQIDVRKVYKRASVVLMPSTYESWGRVAVEAAAAGRPSLATPTPGLLETGIPDRFIGSSDGTGFASWGDPHEWAAAVRDLLEPGAWRAAAYRAHARAVELEGIAVDQMADLAKLLHGLAP
jgi:hypothetical protein